MLAVTVTAKIRIRPNADAEAALSATMAACRDACNTVSEYIFRTGDWKQASIHEALYYKLREQFQLRSQITVGHKDRDSQVQDDPFEWRRLDAHPFREASV